MANLAKDGLAMRLTKLGKRLTCSALALAMAAGPGCHRLPYIDQSKPVPHDALGMIAEEDKEVRQANFVAGSASEGQMQMPRVAPPRTTENPEAEQIWQLTLEEAIRIALDNAETVRVIALGAQGIPVEGFEPTPLNTGAGGGTALGSGSLTTVYDPAIQETQISQALATFDAQWVTNLTWGRNVNPVNNGIQAGQIGGPRFPVVFDSQTSAFDSTLTKRAATGTVFQVKQSVNWQYSNNAFNAFPSAYTTNFSFAFQHPLLGGDQQNGPSGLQANRAPIVISRLQSDQSVWQFKQQIMALVRSVEQQYWALAQQHVQLWSRQFAVSLGEELLKKEQAELEVGRGTLADVAEAEQQLENFRLQWVQATQQIINTERQLRNIMGLPPADNRRIVPATAPSESRIEPDWDSSLAQMVAYSPDIVVQQLAVRVAELNLLIARNQLLPRLDLNALYGINGLGRHLDDAFKVQNGGLLQSIDPLISTRQQQAGLATQPGQYKNFENWSVGLQFSMPIGFRSPLANTRAAQYGLLRQRAFMQQTIHQSIHSLARFFLEVDANYKLYKTAGRARAASAQRLDVQKARYDVGEITIDRYLDAVSQWANTVADEARLKTQYNTSIAVLEEAKGTLLAYNNIAVAEGPYPNKAYVQARDQQAAHSQHPIGSGGSDNPTRVVGPYNNNPTPPMAPLNMQNTPVQPQPVPAPAGPLGPPSTPTAPRVPAAYPTDGMPSMGQTAAPIPTMAANPVPSNLPPLPGAANTPPALPANTLPVEVNVRPASVNMNVGPQSNSAEIPLRLPPLPPENAGP